MRVKTHDRVESITIKDSQAKFEIDVLNGCRWFSVEIRNLEISKSKFTYHDRNKYSSISRLTHREGTSQKIVLLQYRGVWSSARRRIHDLLSKLIAGGKTLSPSYSLPESKLQQTPNHCKTILWETPQGKWNTMRVKVYHTTRTIIIYISKQTSLDLHPGNIATNISHLHGIWTSMIFLQQTLMQQ